MKEWPSEQEKDESKKCEHRQARHFSVIVSYAWSSILMRQRSMYFTHRRNSNHTPSWLVQVKLKFGGTISWAQSFQWAGLPQRDTARFGCLTSPASICIPWPTALSHFTGIPHWQSQTAVTRQRKETWHTPSLGPASLWLYGKHTFKTKKEEQTRRQLKICSVVLKERGWKSFWFEFGAFIWASCSGFVCSLT